eukprot:127954-Alexandrium_andersonii.AAC.1
MPGADARPQLQRHEAQLVAQCGAATLLVDGGTPSSLAGVLGDPRPVNLGGADRAGPGPGPDC